MGKKSNESFKLFVCLGIGMITAGVFSLFKFYNLQTVETIVLNRGNILLSSVLVLLGLMLIFYSLVSAFLKSKKIDEILKKQIVYITFFFVYGLGLMVIGLNFSKPIVEGEVLLTKQFMMFLSLGASIFLGGLYYLFFTLGVYGKKLLVNSISDPKDRVTVVIAIFGSIISLIALFK